MGSHIGLTLKEVNKNQKLYGYNTLNNRNNKIISILKLLNDPIIILSIICSIIYLFLNKYINSIILIIITILTLLFKIYKEYKTNKVIKQMNNMTSINCDVIRDNKIMKIDSVQITVGDVVILNKGDIVCFDAYILESYNLKVDESVLTNDCTLINKSIDLLNKDDKLKSNYVYHGSFIISGRAIVKVTEIGVNTIYNKKTLSTKKSKNKFLMFSYIVSLISFIIAFIISFNNDIMNSIFCAFSITLSFIPFETKNILNTYKFFSMYKLSKNNSIIKNKGVLNKIYTPSYLLVDKEKMITENELKIKKIKTDMDTKELIKHAYLATSKNSKDLIDNAIINYYNYENTDYELIKEYSFSKNNKMMGNVYKIDNQNYIYIKGSLENLFDICDLSVQEKYLYYDCKNEMEKQGLNVVAVASKNIDKIEADILDYEVNFEGIIGLYDKPKDNIDEILKSCQKLGIEPLIFTNDNLNIAHSVASTIKIEKPENIVTQEMLNKANDNEIMDFIKNSNVYSKINFSNKIRIIDTIKNSGYNVLVCSNDIEDLNLLRMATSSICTKNAPDVIKEVSDFILIDNNIDNIVNTINEISNIKTNTKKIFKNILYIQFVMIIITIILSVIKLYIINLPIYITLIKLLISILLIVHFSKKH